MTIGAPLPVEEDILFFLAVALVPADAGAAERQPGAGVFGKVFSAGKSNLSNYLGWHRYFDVAKSRSMPKNF